MTLICCCFGREWICKLARDWFTCTYRVKIYLSFWKWWSQIIRINYFDNIAINPKLANLTPKKLLPQNLPQQTWNVIKIFCQISLNHFLFTQKIRKLFSLMCKVQWVFVSLAFSVLQYKSLGLTEILLLFSLLLWFYTSLIGAVGYINLVSSYVCVFNTWKHNLWDDKMQILLRTARGLHWENKTYKPKSPFDLHFCKITKPWESLSQCVTLMNKACLGYFGYS